MHDEAREGVAVGGCDGLRAVEGREVIAPRHPPGSAPGLWFETQTSGDVWPRLGTASGFGPPCFKQGVREGQRAQKGATKMVRGLEARPVGQG